MVIEHYFNYFDNCRYYPTDSWRTIDDNIDPKKWDCSRVDLRNTVDYIEKSEKSWNPFESRKVLCLSGGRISATHRPSLLNRIKHWIKGYTADEKRDNSTLVAGAMSLANKCLEHKKNGVLTKDEVEKLRKLIKLLKNINKKSLLVDMSSEIRKLEEQFKKA